MIELQSVTHVYRGGRRALDGIEATFRRGEFVAIVGPSGAGKSTLLRILNGLIRPTRGRVLCGDVDLATASSSTVREFRRTVGMIFQQFNLLSRMTALENVLVGRLGYLPVWRTCLRQYPAADVRAAVRLLERVGLRDHVWQRADTLSGGQQQRVGIARALAQRPALLLADEPVSALDPKSAAQIMDLLREIHDHDGIPVLANLHHMEIVRRYASRVLGLRDGRVVFEGSPAELDPLAFRDLFDIDEHGHRPFAATPNMPTTLPPGNSVVRELAGTGRS
jgi:phosphonate transport system ATP-binding protein